MQSIFIQYLFLILIILGLVTIATLLALVMPWLALLLYILLNVFYLWPRRSHESVSVRIDEPT